MADTPKDRPPLLRWTKDWTFSVSGWNSAEDPVADGCFRALANPGDLAPMDVPASWSFHLSLPDAVGTASIILLANGFRISFPQQSGTNACTCLLVKPGILVGRSEPGISPALFCAESEAQRDGNTEWIDLPGRHALLTRNDSADETRFCLMAGQGVHTQSMDSARYWLEENADELFDKEIAQRDSFWNDRQVVPLHRRHLWYAVESLISRIRPPCGAFPFRWSVGDRIEGTVLDANQTLPLVLAWRSIDPSVAEDIVCSVLSCQTENGSIPASLSADGAVLTPSPAWPLLAQAASAAWERRRHPKFLDYVLPRLYRYLAHAVSHTDPRACGIHCWQASSESIIPQAFDAELESPDLATFLICEIEAFLQLCEAAPQFTFDRAGLDAEHEILTRHLLQSLWDNKAKVFRSRYENGTPIERVSVASILPLLWRELPPRHEEPLLRQMNNRAPFHTPCGAPLWLRWEDETETPPIPALHQVLLLEALTRTGARQELQAFASTLSGRLAQRFDAGGDLPNELQTPSDNRRSAIPQPVIPSALSVMVTAAGNEHTGATDAASRKLRWLDRHRAAVIGAAVAILVLGVGVVTTAIIARRTLPTATLEALAGLARQQYASRNYDGAIATYQKLWDGMRGAPAVELLMGNTYFAKGDYPAAEKLFRSVLQKDPKSLTALHNLGLTLFKQNRMDEAAACYRELIQKSGSTHPGVANRARLALGLIAERTGHSS